MQEYEIMEGKNLKEDIMIEEQRSRGQEGKQEMSLREKYAKTPLVKGGKRRGDCLLNKNPTTANATITPHPTPLPQGAREKKCAFTLAEVLITLGIIGIVAAMTLPALVKNYRALVLQNQFKQAYAELNTASRNFYFHNNLISLSEFAVGNSPPTVLKAFSKEFNNVLKSDGRTYIDLDSLPYTVYSMNGKDAYRNTICDTGGWIWDGKGRLIGVDDTPLSGYNGPILCIDINGEKLPNKFGVDFFVFNFTVDGYVIPFGQEHKNNDYDRTLSRNGVPRVSEDYCVYAVQSANYYESTCSNFALSNKHPHKEGKDYWHDFINGK